MTLVTLTADGRRIRSMDAPAYLANKIVGANFRKGSKDWTFPLTLDTCNQLRQVFGPSLAVGTDLGDWVRAQKAHAAGLERARTGRTPPGLPRVRLLAPDLSTAIKLRPYQGWGAAWLLQGPGGLVGDDPGLGKTLQALAAAVEHGGNRILVTCPKTACRTVWERETKRWAPGIYVYVAQGSHKQREAEIEAFIKDSAEDPTAQHMLIINTEMMRIKRVQEELLPKQPKEDRWPPTKPKRVWVDYPEWPQLSENWWDIIIVDESHNALAGVANTRSKNTTQVRYGAMSIRRMLKKDGLPIALSGTPFRSKLTKSWGTLNWIAPKAFTSFWTFAGIHFGADWAEGRAAAPEPLDKDKFNAALRPYYLAREKKDVAKDLPPITYAGQPSATYPQGPNAVWVDMDPAQKQLYEEMRDWAKVRLENGEVTAVGVLAEMTRLRQFACSAADVRYLTEDEDSPIQVFPKLPSAKLDWILEYLLEHEGRDDKVVIASSFTKLINLVALELQSKIYPVLTITGETSQRQRENAVELFQRDNKQRIMILNSFAGGEAITLDRADDMIFMDLPWTSDQAKQVENRIHRLSRIHNVTVHRLLTPDTIEEKIHNMTEEQRRVLASARPEAIDMWGEIL